MRRKLIALFLAAVICMSMSGCIALFSDTYHSETKFNGSEGLEFDSNAQVVQNYSELRRLVFALVNNHEETSDIVFPAYTGNVVSDIASVCNAVKTESAYGAYCVDYISYDLTQIVSYYEAEITVSYKYTEDELQGLMTTSNHDSFRELMARELEKEATKVVVKVNNGTSDNTAVVALIEQTMRDYPMAVSYYPRVFVKIYSGNSSQKIYEMDIQYDEQMDNRQRLNDMTVVLKQNILAAQKDDTVQSIVAAAESLAKLCEITNVGGDCAYDALVSGSANSEGAACAFKAMCDGLGIECMVVTGRMGKTDHYWNIVKVDEDYYHVDVSLLETFSAEEALFLRDSDKQINCWWDQSKYPDCDGELTYTAAMAS